MATLEAGTIIILNKNGKPSEFRLKNDCAFEPSRDTRDYTFGTVTWSNGTKSRIAVDERPRKAEFRCMECNYEIQFLKGDEPTCPECGSTDIDLNV